MEPQQENKNKHVPYANRIPGILLDNFMIPFIIIGSLQIYPQNAFSDQPIQFPGSIP